MTPLLLAVVSLAGPASAQAVADDLAVVKRAVAAQATPAPEAAAAEPRAERQAAKAPKPGVRWLRARIVEKRGAKKVSVNLPLALVQALGDDFPNVWLCRQHRRHDDHRHDERCRLRLGEVLDALESGESLVEVEDEDTNIRVWIE